MADPLTAADLEEALERLAEGLRELAKAGPLVLLGIANGGITLTEILAERLGGASTTGVLNALFHRDDVGLKPVPASFQPTQIDGEIDGARVVLVDDVFASGRTARAAINELFDHGRPASVHLAVLVDTQRARLPVRPDLTGATVPCEPGETIEVVLDRSDPTAHTAHLRRLS